MNHSKKRVAYIDIAKAFGIGAVFFGHISEQIFLSYSPKAHLQFKFIYSFHIPLFFILSGFFAKTQDLRFGHFLKMKFVSRIVPVFLFSILSLPLYLLCVKNIDIKHLLLQTAYLFFGIPMYNFVTWFLVCLFTVEIINFYVFPFINHSRTRLIFCIFLFYGVGWLIPWINQYITRVSLISQFWFIQQAIMAYSLYLFGYLIYKFDSIFEKMSLYTNLVIVVMSASILFITFNLNNGPFFNTTQQVVVVANAIYGNLILFPLTATAGSVFIISFSKLVPESRMLQFLGRNTLILMGLNGILLYINKNLVMFGVTYISDSVLSIFVLTAFLTFVSIASCIPLALLLKKYLSQLIGAPNIKTPLQKVY